MFDVRSGESQISTDDDDLGMQSMAYITTAQAKLDEGDVDGCLKIILQGTAVGAEPAILLSRAHQNVLNGQKKLMALPSAKKSMQPTPASSKYLHYIFCFQRSDIGQQHKRFDKCMGKFISVFNKGCFLHLLLPTKTRLSSFSFNVLRLLSLKF